MTPLIVIQARLGSKRLPRKVLLPLGSKPVLQHVVERCQRTGYPVVVAVPSKGWEAINRAAPQADFFCGEVPEEDVLQRYTKAATAMAAFGFPTPSIVVRITADCPLVDPQLIEASVQAIRDGADYAGNTVERHWPRGCDVESFTTELLLQAHQTATDPYDREHVTPWMQRWASNPIALKPSIRPVEASNEDRWTLDYPGDYRWLNRLWALFPDHPNGPSLDEVAAAIARGAIERRLDAPTGMV